MLLKLINLILSITVCYTIVLLICILINQKFIKNNYELIFNVIYISNICKN